LELLAPAAVKVTLAVPCAPVTADPALTDPGPEVTAKFTVTPEIVFPYASTMVPVMTEVPATPTEPGFAVPMIFTAAAWVMRTVAFPPLRPAAAPLATELPSVVSLYSSAAAPLLRAMVALGLQESPPLSENKAVGEAELRFTVAAEAAGLPRESTAVMESSMGVPATWVAGRLRARPVAGDWFMMTFWFAVVSAPAPTVSAALTTISR
jgi:hypothetical protein